MMRLAPALALVLLAGCNQKQKNCEHARDVYVENAARRSDEAIAGANPQDRAELEKFAKADLDKAKTGFVEHCLALGEYGHECIARIDELAKADLDKRAAFEACPKDENGMPDDACRKKAIAAQEQIVGGCESELGKIVDGIYGR